MKELDLKEEGLTILEEGSEIPEGTELKHVFLVMESTTSEVKTDSKLGLMTDVNGNFVQQPNDKNWQLLIPIDVPEWLKQTHVMQDLVAGQNVSNEPERGGRWYRARIIDTSTEGVVH